MNIPKLFNQKLAEDPGLRSAVDSAIIAFVPWLKDSKLPFFPDYTDHGVDHIEQVLITASALIRDEARKFLTPQDAAALVLATLLHDAAMHLTEDGFIALVAGKCSKQRINGFDDKD